MLKTQKFKLYCSPFKRQGGGCCHCWPPTGWSAQRRSRGVHLTGSAGGIRAPLGLLLISCLSPEISAVPLETVVVMTTIARRGSSWAQTSVLGRHGDFTWGRGRSTGQQLTPYWPAACRWSQWGRSSLVKAKPTFPEWGNSLSTAGPFSRCPWMGLLHGVPVHLPHSLPRRGMGVCCILSEPTSSAPTMRHVG